MSEHELQRVEVLSRVLDGTMRSSAAAAVLALSLRQIQRLVARYRDGGAGSIRHGLRGRPSNNRLSPALRDYALALIRDSYADFGPTLAAEKLAERHGVKVSSETLRKWMMADGLWQSRAHRRAVHSPRLRREHFGELVQIDGSDHRWFEDRGPACSLLVFIDDATGTLMQMPFLYGTILSGFGIQGQHLRDTRERLRQFPQAHPAVINEIARVEAMLALSA